MCPLLAAFWLWLTISTEILHPFSEHSSITSSRTLLLYILMFYNRSFRNPSGKKCLLHDRTLSSIEGTNSDTPNMLCAPKWPFLTTKTPQNFIEFSSLAFRWNILGAFPVVYVIQVVSMYFYLCLMTQIGDYVLDVFNN